MRYLFELFLKNIKCILQEVEDGEYSCDARRIALKWAKFWGCQPLERFGS
jgi:anti-sigma28 factor (negative regulator of flagellin synthesis)